MAGAVVSWPGTIREQRGQQAWQPSPCNQPQPAGPNFPINQQQLTPALQDQIKAGLGALLELTSLQV